MLTTKVYIFCFTGRASSANLIAASSNLPELSRIQTQKLQHLSLLSLARQQSPLPYNTLQSALSLPDSTSLESLVSTAHAASLLTGTLDPQAKLVYIDSVAPLRDLSPGSLPDLAREISEWSGRCAKVLQQLEGEEAQIRQVAKTRTERQAALDEALEKKLAAETTEEKGLRGKRVLDDKDGNKDDDDGMDLDDDQSAGRAKGVKRALMGMMRPGGP